MSGDSFGYYNSERGATGIQWVETRDDAKHSMMQRSKSKNYPIQNANSVKVEKTCINILII